MTPYTKIEDFAAILSNFLSRSQPFYHGVFNPDKILNGLPQNSHRYSISHTLNKLLNSVMEPARELMVKMEAFLEFKQMTHETSVDHKSTTLEVLKGNILCELERLSVATTFTEGLLMKLDGTSPADMTPIVTYVIVSLKIWLKLSKRRYTGNYGSHIGKRIHRDIVMTQTLN